MADRQLTVPGLTGLTVLARGGYATVYRAVQESVGREVAVKIENRKLESERDVRRFLREARVAGKMSGHPHVIDLFDAGVRPDGHPYLIMELCEGSYAERSKMSPLDAEEARDVGVKIADALAHAHALGVLHRDVKPANILITRFGQPALADFGLAILTEARDASITLDILTPAYAPPEVFRHSQPGPPGDVYALCATLYAMMRGRPPRWGDERNPSLISMVDMFAQRIPDLPGVRPEFMRLLREGMANNPEDRPSAARLRETLLALRLHAAVSTSGTMAGERLTTGGSRVITAPRIPRQRSPRPCPEEPASEPPSPPRRRPGWRSLLAIGAAPPLVDPRPVASGDPSRGTSGDGVREDFDNQVTVRDGGRVIADAVPNFAEENPRKPSGASRGRRRAFWAIAGLIEVLAVLASAAIWSASNSATSARHPSPSNPPSASAFASPGGTSQSFADSCGAATGGIARCPQSPECFAEITPADTAATARAVDCAWVHSWEVFAIAELPVEVTKVDYTSVIENAQVQTVCSATTLSAIAWFRVIGWQVNVLPPSPGASGPAGRTYRCLAGKGPNQLEGPWMRSSPT